jgi:hypothetical protein
MAVRKFNGTSDFITTAVGGISAKEAISIAAVVKPEEFTAVYRAILSLYKSGGNALPEFFYNNSGTLGYFQVPTAESTWASAGLTAGWMLLAVSKPAGTTKPKFYVYTFSGATLTSAEGSVTAANRTVAPESIRLGAFEGEFFKGVMAAAAVWNVALTEAQIKELSGAASLEGWKAIASPQALWTFGQASTAEEVKDLIGAANQTAISGTTVAGEEPPIPYTSSSKATLPLAPAVGAASTGLALHAPTSIALGAANGAASTALALHAPTRIPLAPAAGAAGTAMVLTAPSKATLPLAPAVGAASTGLALRAKPRLSLAAAGAASTGMTLSAPTVAPRVIVVREHVPSRLTVIVRSSDGTAIGRWSQDEFSVENVFSGLRKDGDMPGGHKEFSVVLARDPRRSYPDLATFSRVELLGAGDERLWTGTIRQQPQDGERGTIEVKAVGDRQLLEDDEEVIGPGFINCDLSRWTGASTTRRINLLKGNLPIQQDASVTPDAQGDAALHMEVQGGWSSPTLPMCEAWFDAGAGVDIGSVLGDWINGDANTLFELYVAFAEDDIANGFEGSGDLYAATSGHISQSAANARRHALIDWHYSTTPAGVEGAQFAIDLINLKVLGDQGLALQGEWPNVGFTPKQMLPFIVDGSGLTTRDELLEDSDFVIPHVWFSDPTTRMAKLVEVTKYDLLDWFVFNDRILQYRVPGAYGRRWRLAPGSAGPSGSGPDGQRMWDRYMVTWQDRDGTTRMAGAPGSGAPIEDARLQTTDPRNAAVAADNPRGRLIALNGPCEVEPAIRNALRIKEEDEQLDQSGELKISGHVQDDASGAWYPSAYVQPGDWVADPGTSNFRKITGAPYADDQKEVACSIGAPPEGQKAIEERFNARLLEIGLGG